MTLCVVLTVVLMSAFWLSVRYSEGMSDWPLEVYEVIVCPS